MSSQGRQRTRWEDNIREWTGLEFGKSQRAVENRKKMEKTGCKVICGAPTTFTVKGLMMMMMMMMINHKGRHKVCSAVYISFPVLSEPRRCSTEITDVIKWNFRGDTEENMKKKDDLR